MVNIFILSIISAFLAAIIIAYIASLFYKKSLKRQQELKEKLRNNFDIEHFRNLTKELYKQNIEGNISAVHCRSALLDMAIKNNIPYKVFNEAQGCFSSCEVVNQKVTRSMECSKSSDGCKSIW